MSVPDHELLRTTFDDVAELYDRARPTYPAELFDDLAKLARLPERARLVEVGCGTGKATIPLARRGYRITCVDLGAQLAAVARRNLAAFPDVEVVVEAFEHWQPPDAGFDAVVAFTSFHWVPDEAKYAKPASLLRPGGALAVAATQHVLPPGGDDFFRAVQEDYDAVIPDDPHTKAGPRGHPDEIEGLGAAMTASGLFRTRGERRYLWDVVYDADGYVDLLETYSGHRALDSETRADLLGRIRRRIEARPGGTVRKTYLSLLDVAERL